LRHFSRYFSFDPNNLSGGQKKVVSKKKGKKETKKEMDERP
jgi:hypothetical protein